MDVLSGIGGEGYAVPGMAALDEGDIAQGVEGDHVGGDHHQHAAIEEAIGAVVFKHHVAVVGHIHLRRCHGHVPIVETQIPAADNRTRPAQHLPAGEVAAEVDHPRQSVLDGTARLPTGSRV